MRGTPGQRLTSAFSLCVPVLCGGRRAVVTGAGRGGFMHVFVFMCGKGVCVCVWREVLTKKIQISENVACQPFVVIWHVFMSVTCTASSANKPIVWIMLKSRKCVREAHLGCTAPITDHDLWIHSTVCDLFINCDLVMNGFSRQILIKSSVTSLGLKQMSISNYGVQSQSIFHFCFGWHAHLFYIPICPVRWDRISFCQYQ